MATNFYGFDAATVGALPTNFVAISAVPVVVTTTNPVTGANALGENSPSGSNDVVLFPTLGTTNQSVQFDFIAVGGTGSSSNYTNPGVVLRSDASYTNAYVFVYPNGNNINLFKWSGGNYTSLGNASNVTQSLTSGATYTVYASANGSTLSFSIVPHGTAIPSTPQYSVTDSSITTGNYAGARFGGVGNTSAITLDNLYTGAYGTSFSGGFTAPTLSSTGNTTTTATLAWTAATQPGGTVTYQLQQSPHSANTWTNVSGATSSPATATGLSAATTYDYRVVASDGVNTPVDSNVISVTTGTSGTLSSNLATVYPSSTAQVELIITSSGVSLTSGTNWTVSGVTGCSLVSATNLSSTTTALKVIPGTGTGTLTITDTTDSVNCTVAVAAGSIVQPNASTIQLKGKVNVTAQEGITITTGSAGQLAFTGDSIRLRFNMGAVTVGPDILYQVDRDPVQRVSITASNPTVTISPVYTSTTAVKANQHNLKWWYAIYEGAGDTTLGTVEKWTTQRSCGRFAGVDLPGLGSLLTLPPASPSVVWTVGDSITESVRMLYTGSASNQTVELPVSDWSQQLAGFLELDLLQEGYGGTGVTVAGSGSVPAAPNSIGYCYSGVAFAPSITPVIAVLYHGTNDSAASSSTFQAAYIATLNAMRTFAPNVLIFATNPHTCNGSNLASRTSDITAACSGFTGVYVLDAAANAGISLANDTSDGTHLNPGGAVKLSLFFASAIQAELNTLGIKVQATSSGGSGLTLSQLQTALASGITTLPSSQVTAIQAGLATSSAVASLIATTPMTLNQSQPLLTAPTAGTIGEALATARSLAVGKVVYTPPSSGQTTGSITYYAHDGTTVLDTIEVTTDTNGNVLARA